MTTICHICNETLLDGSGVTRLTGRGEVHERCFKEAYGGEAVGKIRTDAPVELTQTTVPAPLIHQQPGVNATSTTDAVAAAMNTRTMTTGLPEKPRRDRKGPRKPRTPSEPDVAELEAMATISSELFWLDADQRRRVLAWLTDRYLQTAGEPREGETP
jgi:hypothetical protein